MSASVYASNGSEPSRLYEVFAGADIADVRSRLSGQLRKTFLQVIAGMVTNSTDYAKHQHSQDHLIAGLQKIAEMVRASPLLSWFEWQC